MALITAEERSQLVALFVSMFDAAPGADNLSDMVTAFEAGTSMNDIATSLAAQPEFAVVYPALLTAEEFANKLADSLLPAGTVAGARDWAVDWVVTNLQAGASRAHVISEAVKALAINTNPDFDLAADLMANKVAVAEYFSITKLQSSDDLSELQDVLFGVTEDATTVDTAKDTVDGVIADNTGGKFTLTAGEDDITGTTGNDTFTAPVLTSALNETLNSVDALDGGDGDDTLNVTLDGGSPGASISNIEVINVRAVSNSTFDAGNTTGAMQIWNSASTANALEISDVDLDDVTIGARNTSTSITLTDAAGDILNLVLDNAEIMISDTGSTALEEVSITVMTDSELNIDGSIAGLEALTIAGDGALDLTISDVSALTTVDASTFGNDLSLDLAGAAALETIVTGAGDDELNLSDSTVLESVETGDGDDLAGIAAVLFSDADDSLIVDLGAGENTLVLTDVNSDNLSELNFISDDVNLTVGVNHLILNANADIDLGGSSQTLDLAGLDDLESITLEDGISGGALTFDNGPAALSVTFESNASSVDLDFGDTVDLVLAFEGDASDVNVTGADLETVTVTLEGFISDLAINGVSEGALDSITLNFVGSDTVSSGSDDIILNGSDDGVSITTLTIDATEASDLDVGILVTDVEDLDTISIALGEFSNNDLKLDISDASVDFGGTVTVEVDAFGGNITYITNDTNNVREVFEFTAAFDGDMTINGFSPGVGANGDRIDLSAIAGLSDTEDLNIVFAGGNTVITAADDQFDGSITIVGVDVSNDTFNFIL